MNTSPPGAERWVHNPKTGERRQLADGELIREGEAFVKPFHLMDAAAKGAAPVTSETLAAGRRIIGDGFNHMEYAALTDAAARRKMVETRLGASNQGKPDAFVDAAFRILVTDQVPVASALRPKAAELVLSDAQRAVAEDGIRRAMAANAAGKTGGAITDAAADGAREAQTHILANRWKSPDVREQEKRTEGMTYEQRIAARFNAAHPAGGYTQREKQ